MNYVEFKNIINKLYGNIIIIGKFNDDLENLIDENKKIISCEHLTNETKNGKGKSKKRINKSINIKKIKKRYKKKKHDFILCNIEDIFKYKKTFIKDSIYITKEEIYLFGKKDEIEDIQEKYKRYTNQIEKERLKEGIVLKIKTNFMPAKLKNIYYYVYDTIMYIIDLISDILIS